MSSGVDLAPGLPKIIPGNHGYNAIAQIHLADSPRNALPFRRVWFMLSRFPHGTEGAPQRTGRTQQQECRGASMKTFKLIRAFRFHTNGAEGSLFNAGQPFSVLLFRGKLDF